MDLFEGYFQDLEKPWEFYERINKNGKSVYNKINVKPETYIEDPNGNYTYFLDNSIKLKKINKKIDQKTYGSTNPGQITVRDKYWRPDNSLYNYDANYWFLDIETTAYKKIDIENCPETIVTIQIFDVSKKEVFLIYTKDSKLKQYKYKVNKILVNSEQEILSTYFKLVSILKPLVVYAWNGDGFDFQYMFRRTLTNGLEPKFSPFSKGKINTRRLENGAVFNQLKAPGIFYMDYMDVYKKFTYEPRASYALDFILKAEIGKGKVEHSCFRTFDGFRTGKDYIIPDQRPEDEFEAELYDAYMNNDMAKAEEISYEKFIDYAIQDVILLYELDQRVQLHKIVMMIAGLTGVNLDDSMGTVKPWANYIAFQSYLSNTILPDDEPQEQQEIKGGFVAEPTVGKFKDVFSVDLNSAYPNLSMRGCNMSPETYIPEHKIPKDLKLLRDQYFNDEDELRRLDDYLKGNLDEFNKLLKKYNMSCGINGALFTKNFVGVIPTLVAGLYGKRKTAKKEMLTCEKNIQLIKDELHKRGVQLLEIETQLELDVNQLKNYSVEQLSAFYNYEYSKKQELNILQMVLKILINSLYGALGNRYFKLFNVDIARAITGNTRFYIVLSKHRIPEFLNKFGESNGVKNNNYYSYSDTDSCYFTLQPISHVLYDPTDDNNTKADKIDEFIKTKIDPVIEENNKEFCDFVNALDSTVVKAEREVIADSAVFVAKKRYFMRVLDNEGVRYETPKIKRMGIEIVRSSTPSFSKKYLDDSINIILDKNNKDLLEWVKDTKQLFTKQKLSEIAKTSSVSNLNYSLDKVQYDQNGRKISIPINSRAALVTNRYIEQNNLSDQFQPISPNDKIKILYMKTPNPLNSNVMAFIDNRFAEMFRQYVDFDENWDKFFLAALEIMTNPLNYDLGNQKEELDIW